MIGVVGAGAFGTALAIALARDGREVRLWDHRADRAARQQESRISEALPGTTLPEGLRVTGNSADLADAETLLLCVPAQTLRAVLRENEALTRAKYIVACCKGIDLKTLRGPVAAIAEEAPHATPAMLTGPSFAADIAKGLPTAVTLACADGDAGAYLQAQLSTSHLRLYTVTDTVGAELGGALKNVIAIGCGVCDGAGLGDSARAALMTRGYAEMNRFAIAQGARPETLAGLSGFGDLALTCTSPQSRNYRYGMAVGRAEDFDPAATVEGKTTAQAIAKLAEAQNIDMPICRIVAQLTTGAVDVETALQTLLSRPLKKE